MNARRLRANLLLLLTAMIWGAAFVSQRVSMDYIGPFTFLCTRSLLGGVVLLPLIAVFSRRVPGEAPPEENRLLLTGGLLCGTALFVASILQQIGIQYTSVGKAGFLTAMYIILIPLCGIFLRRRIAARVWGAVAVAVAGMYFLCLHGAGLEGINRGDLLELSCALCFTGNILIIDRYAGRVDGVKMSCIQFFVCGTLSFIGMWIFESPSWKDILAAWLPIAYAGILSSGAGYSTQMGVMAEELLDKAREILEGCDCDNACQKCLKHYRNQFVQSRLDRFAALELLEYGKTNQLPEIIQDDRGYELIAPMERLLRYEGIKLNVDGQSTVLEQRGHRKNCAIFPAMMKYNKHEWNSRSFVCITKEALKDAKPYALKQMMDAMISGS